MNRSSSYFNFEMDDIALKENRFVSWKILLFVPGLGLFGGLFIAAALSREIARGDVPMEIPGFTAAFCVVGLIVLIWYACTEKNLYYSPTRNGLYYTRPFLKFLFPNKVFLGRAESVELRRKSARHGSYFVLYVVPSSSHGGSRIRIATVSPEEGRAIGQRIQELTNSLFIDLSAG